MPCKVKTSGPCHNIQAKAEKGLKILHSSKEHLWSGLLCGSHIWVLSTHIPNHSPVLTFGYFVLQSQSMLRDL